MKAITVYQADDGTQFSHRDQCLSYEQERADLTAANDLLLAGGTLFEVVTRAHQSQKIVPWNIGFSVDDIEILKSISKDTSIVLHTCYARSASKYKMSSIDQYGNVKLWSERVSPSHFIEAQKTMSLRDLLRVIKESSAEVAS